LRKGRKVRSGGDRLVEVAKYVELSSLYEKKKRPKRTGKRGPEGGDSKGGLLTRSDSSGI